MWKNCSILAHDSWDIYTRNDFSEPRLLHLSIHRKVLSSLTWDVWFSLIHKNAFKIQAYLSFLWQILYNLTSSTASSKKFFQSLLICCSLFLWNFKNIRGIEECLHAITTTWIWIVNFLKNTQFFKLSNSRWVSLF